MKAKMQIEIWSDIMCPFCYIGKRKYEMALSQFVHADDVEVKWKSFQLSPDHVTDTTISNYDYLSRHKGISTAEAKRLSAYVADKAKEVGLHFDFDKVIIANTFRAHRFLHFANTHGVQNQAKELLLRSYFSKGKNVDDIDVLLGIAAELGLDKEETEKVLESDLYANNVRQDIYESHQIGVRGVPYFVFDDKWAVSGAQEPTTFLGTLEKSYGEWKAKQPRSAPLVIADGEACAVGEVCE